MRLPDFLVIGAMKSGTTTFYHDLAAHPQVFLAEKELGALTRDVSMTEYASHFQWAKINQLCGDVSTVYSMLPDVPGVAQRAMSHLSPNTKILYLVREPIQRAISHHYHYHSLNDDRQMEADVDVCVRKYPSLTNYGKYGEQLEHWARHWGETTIHVVHFEEYVINRRATMAQVFRFLGLRPSADVVATKSVKNASLGKPVLNDFWRRLTQHSLYRKLVRPCLSLAMRDRIRGTLLPLAPPPPPPPAPETIDELLSVFIPDGERLLQVTNRAEHFWDYRAVRAAHVERWRLWQASAELRKSA
jgi:hypothetical protein